MLLSWTPAPLQRCKQVQSPGTLSMQIVNLCSSDKTRSFKTKTCSMISPITRIGCTWVRRKNAIIVVFVLGADQTSALPAPLTCRWISHRFQDLPANLPHAAWLCLDLYLSELLALRSTIQGTTIRPAIPTSPSQIQAAYVREQRFCLYASKLWNSLPGGVREAASLDTFRKKVLKTYLFGQSVQYQWQLTLSFCHWN